MSRAHEKVTDFILNHIDKSDGNWKMPWSGYKCGMPQNHVTGNRYRGSNILTCWITSMIHGYTDERWATYRQWQAAGGQVRKGERGTPIIYYGEGKSKEEDKKYLFARSSMVFNIDQVDGISLEADTAALLSDEDRIHQCEEWVAERAGMFTLKHGTENRAYYRPSDDTVNMPRFELFRTPQHYYSTLFHELTHWTGAKHRLDREFRREREDIAKEELVAELGSAFLAAEMGLITETRDDHVDYIANWIKALENDKTLIVTAASQASRAVDFLTTLAEEERVAA